MLDIDSSPAGRSVLKGRGQKQLKSDVTRGRIESIQQQLRPGEST